MNCLSCLRNVIQTTNIVLDTMQKLILPLILFSFNAFIPSLTAEQNETNQSLWKGDISAQENLKTAFVIPIKKQIGPPILDILRRGMKYAIASGVDLVVLDMDTPGG